MGEEVSSGGGEERNESHARFFGGFGKEEPAAPERHARAADRAKSIDGGEVIGIRQPSRAEHVLRAERAGYRAERSDAECPLERMCPSFEGCAAAKTLDHEYERCGP